MWDQLKPQAECAVLFDRPWSGQGTKRFVADDDLEVGIALGLFLVNLYKRNGRAVEIAFKRTDGSTQVMSGAEFEKGASIDVMVLS